MLIPLLWISLIAEPQVAAAKLDVEYAKVVAQLKALREQRRDETFLLSHRLEIPELALWSGGSWRSASPNEVLATRGRPGQVRIVHLWADWCGPCREEFPRLKHMVEQFHSDSQQDIQLILVATTTDPERVRQFWTENSTAMPIGMQYGDTSGMLANAILQILPQGVLPITPPGQHAPGRVPPLPLTLVLDDQSYIRMALVGSLEGRHGALLSGVAQLCQGLAAPPPTRGPYRKLLAGRRAVKN